MSLFGDLFSCQLENRDIDLPHLFISPAFKMRDADFGGLRLFWMLLSATLH